MEERVRRENFCRPFDFDDQGFRRPYKMTPAVSPVEDRYQSVNLGFTHYDTMTTFSVSYEKAFVKHCRVRKKCW